MRELGYSRFLHAFPQYRYLSVEKRVWVPLHLPAVVFTLLLRSQAEEPRALRLFVEARASLGLGWPRRDVAEQALRFDPDLQAMLAEDAERGWLVLWGARRPPAEVTSRDSTPARLVGPEVPAQTSPQNRPTTVLRYDLDLEPQGVQSLDLIVVGGMGRECLGLYREVEGRLEELFRERTAHYRNRALSGVALSTPDPHLNKAFVWAKTSLEDFKHFDPALGLCYFAGFPAYNFYFASDTFRLLPGAIGTGDWEETREIIRMIVRYQAQGQGPDTLPGEIWHEMSTSGERISPNFCTLDFPPVLEDYYRWTGDRSFVEEVYTNLRAAVEWGYLNDRDGDGFLENGPEGEMADSAFEDTNMEGSHLAPNLAWCRALRAGCRLAAAVGDHTAARRWRETEAELAPRLADRYWSEARKRFEETLRPDGSLDASWRGISVVDEATVGSGLARFGLDRLEAREAELTDPRLFLEWRSREEPYAGWREASSYYLVERGDRARTLLGNHRLRSGLRALLEIARLPFTLATPGHFPEVISFHDLAEPYVRGCIHQAWSGPCGVLLPVIEGLFGVHPDAANHAVTVLPHLPDEWPEMRLDGVQVGSHRLTIVCRRTQGTTELSVHNEAEESLTAVLGVPLPSPAEIKRLEVDGRPLGLDEEPVAIEFSVEDAHLLMSLEVAPRSGATVRAWVAPAPLALDVPVYAARTLPGGNALVSVAIRNQGHSAIEGRMCLELPAALAGEVALFHHSIALAPGQAEAIAFSVSVPRATPAGYHELTLRLEECPGVALGRPVFLPVFPQFEADLEGRTVAKVGRPYPLRTGLTNLTSDSIDARVEVELPPGLRDASTPKPLRLAPGATREALWWLTADEAGHPLLALGRWGGGRVAALALDCFGYGSTGTFLAWPGVKKVIRRVVGHLVGAQ